MKTQLAVIVAVALFAPVLGAQSVCSKDHRPDRIRVRFIGECGNPRDLQELRVGGDSRFVLLAAIKKDEGYWEGRGFPSMIKSVQLCSNVCGVASSCVSGKATPDRDKNGSKICVAEYEFRCDEPAWTLNVSSTPLVTLSYTRRRPEAESVEQRGELKAAPGRLCDLASDETVSLKPQVKPYSFRDIVVSKASLVMKRNTWTLGASELLRYVELPGGRRPQGASDAESAFVQQDLKELKLTIEPAVR